MKAAIYNVIRLLETIVADFSNRIIPADTKNTVIERYTKPAAGYAVDLAIIVETSVGKYIYENVILFLNQFEVVKKYNSLSAMSVSNSATQGG